jgi:limonene-1,2-epoxide hydrolase
MSANVKIVEDFLRACDGKDLDKVASFFTEDCFYHNIPMELVRGPAMVKEVLSGFQKVSDTWDFKLHHIAETAGGAVLTERSDCIRNAQGEWLPLPVMGIFELRDGKISAWRDYFDLAQVNDMLQRAFASKS